MHFIEIDCKERECEWSMSALQSHNYYELYFLMRGTRRFFLNDKIYHITAPTVCIIPSFCMHKTAGGAYRRININVAEGALDSAERAYLDELGKSVVYSLDEQGSDLLLKLLESAVGVSRDQAREQLTVSFLHVLLHLLRESGISALEPSAPPDESDKSTVAMQVAAYIHANYSSDISIKALCEQFFISKNTLCRQFKALLHCPVMKYLQLTRISKAKALLESSKKSVREIAEECGFSSANYFSLIFKHEVGISPASYRKAK